MQQFMICNTIFILFRGYMMLVTLYLNNLLTRTTTTSAAFCSLVRWSDKLKQTSFEYYEYSDLVSFNQMNSKGYILYSCIKQRFLLNEISYRYNLPPIFLRKFLSCEFKNGRYKTYININRVIYFK